MATPNPKLALGGIARRLVHDGVLDDEAARAATEGAQKEKQSIVRYLVASNHATGRQVAAAAMQEFGLPLVDLDTLDPEVQPINLVDTKLIEKHRAVPLHKRGNRVYLAIADPTNMVALDEFKFATGLTTEPVLVEDDKLSRRIDQILSAQEMGSGVDDLDEDLENLDVGGDDEEA